MILHGVVKLMTKLIHLGSKPRRVNPALICSNVLTARVLILLTPMIVSSGNTTLIRSGTPKNTPSSGKPGKTGSIQV